MKIGIMQPYLFPYIGYFQLIRAVDRFVIHDNVQYIKGGWINRNRFLHRTRADLFTWSVRKDSSRRLIVERSFSDRHSQDGRHFLNRMRAAYCHAPFFSETFPLLENAVAIPELVVSRKIAQILALVCKQLRIHTPLLMASTLSTDKRLKAETRVIDLCHHLEGTHYINLIGGTELYHDDNFAAAGLQLSFLKPRPMTYRQFDAAFVPNLSIIDVMMFNSVETIGHLLDEYDLVRGPAATRD
jgi:hypothetical protein